MELSHQILLIADFLRKLFFEHYLILRIPEIHGSVERALKNLSNSKPNNNKSGAATPLCCDPAFIRIFRKYLKNSPNNASQTYI